MIFDSSQILAYLPMLILVGIGCVILLAETFATAESRRGLAWLGVGVIATDCVGGAKVSESIDIISEEGSGTNDASGMDAPANLPLEATPLTHRSGVV